MSPPGWGRGCQPCSPATTARSQAGDIPTPMQRMVAIATLEGPPLAPWCTLPRDHGCAELLLLSSLWLTTTNPPQPKPAMAAGFSQQGAENSVEGSTQPLLLSVQTVHIHLSCSAGEHRLCKRFLKGTSSVLVTDHSCAWLTKDKQCWGEGGEGRCDSPLHDFLSVPAKSVILNGRAVVADVLWQAAVKTAVGLQLRNEFPGRKGGKTVLS